MVLVEESLELRLSNNTVLFGTLSALCSLVVFWVLGVLRYANHTDHATSEEVVQVYGICIHTLHLVTATIVM